MPLSAPKKNSTRPRAMSALREIARALSTAVDLDTTLDLIARKTTEVMDVDSCTIYLLDPQGEFLRLRATTGLARRALGRATLRVGEGLTGQAVARNAPVYAADAQHASHFKWVDEAEEMAFHSLLAVPFVLEDNPIGAMNVQTVAVHEYNSDEIEILALIADLAAGAITKANFMISNAVRLRKCEPLLRSARWSHPLNIWMTFYNW